MADLIYTTNVSLDGYIEDPSGDFRFSEPSDDVFAFITDIEREAGTYLYGRRLYETMAVWETERDMWATTELMTAFADMWQGADKIVYSTSLDAVFTEKTRLERRFDPDTVRALKAAHDGHLTIGGANLGAEAFAAGLVDEVRLFVSPVSVGGGKPALPLGQRVNLELIEEQRFASGAVYLRYRVKA